MRSIRISVPVLVLASTLVHAGGSSILRRADANCDGSLDVSDGVFTLLWLFADGVAPCCLDAADSNDDGVVDVSDPSFALAFLFNGGSSLPPPAFDCGGDPTPDDLLCTGYSGCEPVDHDPVLTEWRVPWSNSRPRDPYVAADGRVWFVGQRDDYAAVLDLDTEQFTRFDLPSGAGPHNLIVGDWVWYAGNTDSHIGRLDPATGNIVEIPMPLAAARDPHTLVFNSDGDIWFTVQNGNFVGKLDTETLDVRLVVVPTSRARPYGIVLDSNDRPWIAEFGTNKIATVDPVTFELEEISLPRSGARPRRLVVTSDDIVWYVDHSGGYLGRLDPGTGAIEERRLPGGSRSRPYGMAVDHRDRIWCVESGPDPNRFVGFNPATETFFSVTEIESGGGTVRHMYFDEPTRAVWFGTDANTVGRAVVE